MRRRRHDPILRVPLRQQLSTVPSTGVEGMWPSPTEMDTGFMLPSA
jgi:hypothetical protein